MKSNYQRYLPGFLFLAIIPSAAHFLFSHLGFNPTDDGNILAGCMRILEGQVPHKDFISLRPAGSFYLHSPTVLIGGEKAIWLSRYFVWIQFGVISWIWACIIREMFKIKTLWIFQLLLGLTAFAFCVHTFPILAWHSIDALFFASLGMFLVVKTDVKNKVIGYFLIGTTLLFRQNFIFIIPATLLLLNEYRQIKYWLAACLPGLIYILFLITNNALSFALSQLTTQSDLIKTGIISYVSELFFTVGIITGIISALLIKGKLKKSSEQSIRWEILGILIISGLITTSAITLYFGRFFGAPSIALFGTVVGIAIYQLFDNNSDTNGIKISGLVIIISWCVSVSIGYNSPALASGLLVLFLIYYIKDIVIESKSHKLYIFFHSILVLQVAMVLICFWVSRHQQIYREQSADKLTYKLDNVLPAGQKLRTNSHTYEFLKDLQLAIEMSDNMGYCIMPDLAGYWVNAPQKNPIPIDWATRGELYHHAERVISQLDNIRGSNIIIVQKVVAKKLPYGFEPLAVTDKYPAIIHVKENFEKIGETKYFEIFK